MRPQTTLRSKKAVFLSVLALLTALYVCVTYAAVAHHASLDEARPADAIVVFGAAEYSGRPSPVLRARLDHALELYRRKLAPFVIVTGGRGGDPSYSEGEVGRDYLVAHGVPEDQAIAETHSDDTSESAQRVGNIMHVNGLKTCLAVSDAYHMYRIERMMHAEGIITFGAPRPLPHPLKWWQKLGYYMREVASITLWRLHVR